MAYGLCLEEKSFESRKDKSQHMLTALIEPVKITG